MPKRKPVEQPAVPKRWEELKVLFKQEVWDRSAEVDPDNEHHWLGLTVGWAIAKGLPPEEANRFAVHVRYATDLG